LSISEAQPIFGEERQQRAKVVQAERRTKQETKFFVFYPEAQPILPEAEGRRER